MFQKRPIKVRCQLGASSSTWFGYKTMGRTSCLHAAGDRDARRKVASARPDPSGVFGDLFIHTYIYIVLRHSQKTEIKRKRDDTKCGKPNNLPPCSQTVRAWDKSQVWGSGLEMQDVVILLLLLRLGAKCQCYVKRKPRLQI